MATGHCQSYSAEQRDADGDEGHKADPVVPLVEEAQEATDKLLFNPYLSA